MLRNNEGLTDEEYGLIKRFIEEDVGEADTLEHVGIGHEGDIPHSGRFEWGSGENPFQRYSGFIGEDERLKRQGLSVDERAARVDLSTERYRARISYLSAATKARLASECGALKEQGYSNLAIAKKLGISDGSVKAYLKNSEKLRNAIALSTVNALKDKLASKDGEGNDIMFVDVGKGCGARMNIPEQRVANAVMILEDMGYQTHNLRIKTGPKQYTTTRVLARPGVDQRYCYKHLGDMGEMSDYSEDGGRTFKKQQPPPHISMDRITIRYSDDGKTGAGDGVSGELRDGVIELRRGVPDLDLGKAHYAQVRIAIEGGLYAKGMAVYADDLPDGVDIRINSNKPRGTPMSKVFKEQKNTGDEGNPFGATIKEQKDLRAIQRTYVDPKTGQERPSALNIVNEEGNWEAWSRNLAHQFLSKQPVSLARRQLELDTMRRQADYEQIMGITNPVLRQEMLYEYARSCDSASVHMKAAALPRQQTHVILPLPSIKPNEIFAPNYDDGEEVILVRFPHSGIFEIPRLIVNNNSRTGKKIITTEARDAVGIHPKAAAQLSGADFDGDTVLVIPTRGLNLETKAPLKGLVGFDPKTQYATTDDDVDSGRVKIIKTKQRMGNEMGRITNLITDMQISGKASEEELERAVKHSMVIVDSWKHKLDYTRSERENGIAQLREKYQPVTPEKAAKSKRPQPGGAGTIFSRASAEIDVPKRKGSPHPDPKTGKLIYRLDPQQTVPDRRLVKDPKTGEPILDENGRKQFVLKGEKANTQKSTRMAETDDAYTLTSGGSRENPGHVKEAVYAEYANGMKARANRARKEAMSIATPTWNRSAEKVYAEEVAALKKKVVECQARSPLERKARAATQAEMRAVRADNPLMEYEDEKKREGQTLKRMRQKYGADKSDFILTDREWEAIQAGALSKTMQKEIFRFCDQTRLKELAYPKAKPALGSGDVARAKSLLAQGYSSAEVAKLFGVSTTTIHNYIAKSEGRA